MKFEGKSVYSTNRAKTSKQLKGVSNKMENWGRKGWGSKKTKKTERRSGTRSGKGQMTLCQTADLKKV